MTDSSTKTTKAVRATIYLGTIPLEVFQLPDGKYWLSQTGVAEAVGNDRRGVSDFSKGKSPEAIPYKNFKCRKLAVEGLKTKINGVPIEIASAYWLKEALSGNLLAIRLLGACAAEAIERRADTAFDVQRTEAERQERMDARIKGKLTRRTLTDAIADYLTLNPDLSENKVKFIYSNVSDAVNLKVLGRKASKLRTDLGVPEEGLLRDFYNSRELLYVQEVEDIAVRLIDLDAMDPLLAVKEAASRLLITIQTRTK